MKGRLAFVGAVFASWLLAAGVRLYQVQVLDHDHYAERASRQQQRVVVLDPPRGAIYDARGRELAVSLEVTSLGFDPSESDDPQATLQALDGVLRWSAEKRRRLHAEAAERGREFLWIARKLDPATIDRVRALGLDGLVFLPESKRYYPLGPLAASVLGYVGTDRAGLAGLEFLFDKAIASAPGQRTVFRDARLDTVLHPQLAEAAPRPGEDLHLTLDAAIQHVVERELEAAAGRTNAPRGSIVVMEPKSGAILAMASYPGFDPNHYGDYPPDRWRNRAVMDAYEPGSTFKMVTLAAALEQGAYGVDDVIDCGMGGITLGGVRINDHKPFGLLTVRQVLAKSSNVGAIRLGLGAGKRRLYDTIVAFGFGRPTGVDLPSESPGILRPLERWTPITPAYLSFGQGLSITPLQLTAAFAAIANGGLLPKPHVVAAIGDTPIGPRLPAPVPLAPSTLAEIRSILGEVVSDGTAKLAAIPGYPAAGKTGTAQKAVAGGYAASRFVASFVGFVPADDPAIVVTVVLDEPWPAYHGGDAAAPAFQAIAEQVLLYLGHRPRRERPERWPGEPPRRRLDAEPIPGVALAAFRPDDLAATPLEEAPDGTVPRLLGLPARAAVQKASGLGLRIALAGSGIVVGQAPAPGTPLEAAGDVLRLELSTDAL